MTAVVNRSELAGKPVKPDRHPDRRPETALLQAVRDIGAEELLLGPPRAESPDARLDRLVASWRSSPTASRPG